MDMKYILKRYPQELKITVYAYCLPNNCKVDFFFFLNKKNAKQNNLYMTNEKTTVYPYISTRVLSCPF